MVNSYMPEAEDISDQKDAFATFSIYNQLIYVAEKLFWIDACVVWAFNGVKCILLSMLYL